MDCYLENQVNYPLYKSNPSEWAWVASFISTWVLSRAPYETEISFSIM